MAANPARTIEEGGPWLELFDHDVESELSSNGGEDPGPLADFTFAIKDLVAVAGRRVTAGSPVLADAAPETTTAPIVDSLRAKGAVARGSVTLHEFAFGVTGLNDAFGTAANPNAPGRCPGGSSSGSASAVADGSARIAIGTDTGGSVRIPAAFCGVTGFKPAFDTYPTDGVFALSPTLDHVGFLARDVDDIITVHSALTSDVVTVTPPVRIAVIQGDLDPAEPPVKNAVSAAIEMIVDAFDSQVVKVEWPDPEATFVASTTIISSEAATVHRDLRAAHEDRYGADILARLEMGAALPDSEVTAAHRIRGELIEQVSAALDQVDIVITPTVRLEAPTIEDAADPAMVGRIVANTRLGNVVGLPAISIPVPTDGLPVGVQLTGATNAGVLGAAAAIEAVLGSR